jgi:hypothetical protein
MARIALIVLFKMMVVHPLHADSIGDISELKGFGQIVRDQPYPAILDFNIESYDNVQTRAGRIAITFLDNTQVRLTEHSNLVIDEYIYTPDNSSMSLKFASGTIRYISGALNKKKVKLTTDSAEIAILGTDFTVTTTEFGSSLIILLPDEFGNASGEIIVSTGAGQVTLNQPYQATTTSVFESAPTKPVTLDITLDFIDNMLIINPPKEVIAQEEESQQESTDYLDYNELDVDLLNEDFLKLDEDFEFTELDIDYLDVNFLEDLLDVLDALDTDEQDQLAINLESANISGTSIGQDTETQITTFIQGERLTMQRVVNQQAYLDLDSGGAYTVIFIQDGVSRTVKINGGSSSSITITQNP